MYKYESVYSMLDQLDRDLGISSIDNRIHYIYWIGECIERIGALPQMLEDRVTFNDPTNLIIPSANGIPPRDIRIRWTR
jgi:hypothetical protein